MTIKDLQLIHLVNQCLAMNDRNRVGQLIQQAPKQAVQSIGFQYAQGMLALSRSDHHQAIQSLKSIKQYFLEDHQFLNNLGHALLQVKQSNDALLCFEEALVVRPDHQQIQYNRVAALIALGEVESSADALKQLLEKDSQNALYHCALADVNRLLMRYQSAITGYHKAIGIDPKMIAAHSNLSVLLVEFGQYDKALKHADRALLLAPELMLTHLNKGRVLTRLERFEEAMVCFADGYEIEQNSSTLCVEIAHMWRLSGDLFEAADWYHKALSLNSESISAQLGLVKIHLHSGESEKALRMTAELMANNPDHHEIMQAHADALWDEGDVETALSIINNLTDHYQQNPNALSKAAQMMASSGSVEESYELYEKALELNPRCIAALNGLAVKQGGHFNHDLAMRMNVMINNTHIRPNGLSLLHNGLAYYFHGNQAYEQAAFHMAEANANQWNNMSRRNWDYDLHQHQAHIQNIKSIFSQEWFESGLSSEVDSEEPVFVVSMPRSGTTLTEQILSRHPLVLGIGERNFVNKAILQISTGFNNWQQAIPHLNQKQLNEEAQSYLTKLHAIKARDNKAEAIRVIDKLPDNYSNLGWILALFPKAKIIHVKRDPRDVALSCWMTQFGKIQWASRWPDLLDRIHQYQSLMQHWQSVIPDRFMEINYEDLVHDQENISKQMIEFLGLKWDPACLSFYDSDRIVRTASITQVRKPIYRKSVNKWKHYEPYISELKDIICI